MLDHEYLTDEFDRQRHEERIAKEGKISVAFGDDLKTQTRLPDEQLLSLVGDSFHEFIDGGGNIVIVYCRHGEVMAYAKRKGRMVDVGTRSDWEILGLGKMCDLLDARVLFEGS